MTELPEALAGYLDLRRGLGFKLDRDAKLLAQFITYLEERGTGTLTVADALTWATLPTGASPGWLAFRMSVVRGFAAYLDEIERRLIQIRRPRGSIGNMLVYRAVRKEIRAYFGINAFIVLPSGFVSKIPAAQHGTSG